LLHDFYTVFIIKFSQYLSKYHFSKASQLAAVQLLMPLLVKQLYGKHANAQSVGLHAVTDAQ